IWNEIRGWGEILMIV
ncbi:hypothetical protein ACNVD4_10395, partial [Rhizobium sp. BR5]